MPLDPAFVRTSNTGFVIGDLPFPVVGVNSYFLAYCSDASRLAVMAAAKGMGANVIRSWAFLDLDPRPAGSVAFQYLQDGKIVQDGGPDGLERLDALIGAADDQGLRLILPLVNHWGDFGGMPQYLKWLGIQGGVEQFYSSPAARAAYRTWVESVLTRRNTRTGRLYSEEPAVMAWELANEPRCEVAGGRELLLDWVGEMSAYVKSLDSNHLLALGDEGFLQHADTSDPLYNGSHGVDGEAILNFGQIDFGTYHFYPSAMGHGNDFGDTWVKDHVESGARAGKPTIMEEYGLETAAERDEWYPQWLGSVRLRGGAGDLLWMLGSSEADVSGFRDTYTVLDGSEVPAVAEHAREMQGSAQSAHS